MSDMGRAVSPHAPYDNASTQLNVRRKFDHTGHMKSHDVSDEQF